MDTKTLVQEKYGAAAREVRKSGTVACGDPSLRCCDPITTNLYNEAEKSGLPASAVLASLGCGNPTALIELKAGETVLDLGSGGGIDVLLSAKRVGPTGKAYGLDMTDDMLALARENQRQAGVENVEFLQGEIEKIPLPDNSVDVVISNCVINLSADKDCVLREAFRVLKPGGRFAVSDVVTRGEVPAEVRQSMLLWVGCVAGALEEKEYMAKLASAGFAGISVEPTRVHSVEDARHFLVEAGIDVDAIAPLVDGKFMSAFIRAEKPMPSLYTDAVAELVAIGAAIAANCDPCFKYHFQQARKIGVSRDDMMRAVKTAQSVKETPAKAMLQLAHQYLEADPAGLPIVQSCCG
jgi:AhpD family alkylhydroperoxidase